MVQLTPSTALAAYEWVRMKGAKDDFAQLVADELRSGNTEDDGLQLDSPEDELLLLSQGSGGESPDPNGDGADTSPSTSDVAMQHRRDVSVVRKACESQAHVGIIIYAVGHP